MNNSDNRLTTSNTADDRCPDSSDVLSLLYVIERLYENSRHVIASHSAAAILLSMAVELQMLLTKLLAMHRRWNVHLPFKEACSVDFTLWSSKAAQMAEEILSGDWRYCLYTDKDIPSCHCLVDLYDQAISRTEITADSNAHIVETDAKQMLSRRATMQEALNGQRAQCVDAITQIVTAQLSSKYSLNLTVLSDLLTVRKVCSSLLRDLSDLLQQIHDQLVKFINAQEYERLADRILFEAEYEGPKARREAREVVVNWRNGVPVRLLDSERKKQIELAKEEIRKTKYGVKLEQYVDLDDDFQKQRSEFGRFLFNRRREISRTELRQLILLVYCVYYYQQDAYETIGKGTVSIPDTQSPIKYPALPADFQQALRDCGAAVTLFYETLEKIEPFINGGKPAGSTPEMLANYKDWTWYHLQAAFERLGFLPKGSSKAGLARFLNSRFSHRTVESIQRSLYRNTNTNSPNIVADVVKEFRPVRSLISTTK